MSSAFQNPTKHTRGGRRAEPPCPTQRKAPSPSPPARRPRRPRTLQVKVLPRVVHILDAAVGAPYCAVALEARPKAQLPDAVAAPHALKALHIGQHVPAWRVRVCVCVCMCVCVCVACRSLPSPHSPFTAARPSPNGGGRDVAVAEQHRARGLHHLWRQLQLLLNLVDDGAAARVDAHLGGGARGWGALGWGALGCGGWGRMRAGLVVRWGRGGMVRAHPVQAGVGVGFFRW